MFGNGLSLDQAPPFEAPRRFFLTTPIFGILAGLLLLISGDNTLLLSRWSPQLLAEVHLITLGMFSMTIVGALLQMLPVLAGISIPGVLRQSIVSHLLLSYGTLFFASGFLLSNRLSLGLGLILSATGLLYPLLKMLFYLLNTSTLNSSIRSIKWSALFGITAILLGSYLGIGHLKQSYSSIQIPLANIHIILATFGFVSFLVLGISYQVIPMFYVTGPYPNWFQRWALPTLLTSLLGWIVCTIWLTRGGPNLTIVFKIMLSALFGSFAVLTLHRIEKRKRAITDMTIRYWRAGMVFLLLSIISWNLSSVNTLKHLVPQLNSIAAIFLGGGFLLSVIYGMLIKIYPFLIWFHLTNMGASETPTMRQLMPAKKVFPCFILHLLSILSLTIAIFWNPAIFISGVAFTLSNMLILLNLLSADKAYQQLKIDKSDTKLDSSET